jgi:dTDP-4-amino-4,6-dideoxygalactose transaminase
VLQFNLKNLNTSRTKIMARLRAQNVGSQVHYIPIYQQPYHAKKMSVSKEQFPNTEKYYQNCLSIPLYPHMTDDDVAHVIKTIVEVSTS